MQLYTFVILLLMTIFTSVATGVIIATKYKEQSEDNKHWAWATIVVVLILVTVLITSHSKQVTALEITRARMSAGETGKWTEAKNKKGETVRTFSWNAKDSK